MRFSFAKLIGRPYVWARRGQCFRCSGLMQYGLRSRITLPPPSINESGDSAGRRLERGDLLFLATEHRQSSHPVGVYEGNNVMIDASRRHGRVRRDDLDDPFWIERFLFARRVDGSATDYERGDQEDRDVRRARRRIDKREIVVRTAEVIAGVLFKRPAR